MKISIFGAGNVGSNIASQAILLDIADEICLIDILDDFACGKVLDLSQSACVFDKDIKIYGGNNPELIKNSDICIITAGIARKQGQSREDLAKINLKIIAEISQNIAKFAPKSLILVVTNPLDEMVYFAQKFSGFDKKRVFGMAGELDNARFKFYLSQFLNTKISQTKTAICGTHNENMICLNSNIQDEISDENLEKINFSTINGGAKIVELTKTSAYFAPASGVCKILFSIYSQKPVFVTAFDGDLPIGKMAILDKFGVKEFIELKINDKEKEKLKFSIEKLKNSIEQLNKGVI